MEDVPRIITEREIFENKFLATWRVCLGLALNELNEIGLSHKDLTPYTYADILSATAQLFIAWNTNRVYIQTEQQRKQDEWNRKFAQPIIKQE